MEHSPANQVLVIIIALFLDGALLILEDHPGYIVSIVKVIK